MSGELRTCGLTKSYGDTLVLDKFSQTFPCPGTVALMGPSGCGKTTLLRLLAELERPDSGRVERRNAGGKVSMVFQEDRLLEVLTARENICAVLPAERRELAALCLARCGLGEAAELYPAQMSGGMKRRLAIARAVAFAGDILLLDEPFKGLDLETKRLVMELVFSEVPGLPSPKERLTLLVTHDVDEAMTAADRILLLEGTPLRVGRAFSVSRENQGAPERQQLRENLIALLGRQSGEL